MTGNDDQNKFGFKTDDDNGALNQFESDPRLQKWSNPQRTHLLSILIHASKLAPIFVAFYLPEMIGGSVNSSNRSSLYFFVIYIAIIFIFWFISWRFRTFWIKQYELVIQHRFITKKVKHLPLDRIQSIDVIEPLLGRILGLAALRITSGATSISGKSSIAYLKVTDAKELREILLRQREIIVQNETEVNNSYNSNSIDYQTSLKSSHNMGLNQNNQGAKAYWFQMSPSQLMTSIITPFIIPVSVIIIIDIFITLLARSKNIVGVSVGISIPAAVSLVSELWRRFSRLSGYKIEILNDSLRVTSGLLTINHETIPFHRVQALRIEQPFLWKLFRLYRLQINLAGTTSKTRTNRQNLTLIPACGFHAAVSLIRIIQPQFNLGIPMIPPPKISFIKGLFWANVHRLGLTKDTAILNYGIFKKRWDLIYFGKIQSLRIKTGPVNRLLGLNNLHIDSTKGPIEFHIKWRSNQDAAEVFAFLTESTTGMFANIP